MNVFPDTPDTPNNPDTPDTPDSPGTPGGDVTVTTTPRLTLSRSPELQTAFYKDDPVLAQIALTPSKPYTDLPSPNTKLGRLARIYNRIGGLLEALASKTGVSEKSALSVWYVESGGEKFLQNRPILRFENHKFWRHWGTDHSSQFDTHFQFGGHAGANGKPWENHRFRVSGSDPWGRFHGDQAAEYEVFDFAAGLGGLEAACLSSSFGGPQVLGSNFRLLGYENAVSLFEAFKQSERWHVCGFLDFCISNSIVDEIKNKKWRDFARVYNGAGHADEYAALIKDAYDTSEKLDTLPRADSAARAFAMPTSGPAGISTDFDMRDFATFIDSLGLEHIKAYELLFKGHQHSDTESPAYGLNTDPPRALWPNIVSTVKVLDRLRESLAAPIVLTSIYRSPAYNAAIAGAGGSQHMKFNAIDFVVRNHMSPDTWAAVLKEMRADGIFKGGIGTYLSFIHLDTRGYNATW